jgi:serine protease AprX
MSNKIIHIILFLFWSCSVVTAQAYIDPKIDLITDNFVDVLITFNQADLTDAQNKLTKDEKANYVYNQLTSTTKSQEHVKNILKELGINFQSFYVVNCINAKIPKYLVTRFASMQYVTSIVHNSSLKMLDPIRSVDEGSRAIEWGISKVEAPAVWALGHIGTNVVIGGQDTGYEWDHPAIKNMYRGWNGADSLHNYNWHDAISAIDIHNTGSNPCGLDIPYPCDDDNHGTHTMGTMAGDDDGSNQIGVAPGARWIGCRNMERGWGTPATYLECFEWFLAPYPYNTPSMANPALMPHVINNSWGCPTSEGCNPANFGILNTAVNNLRNAGCVVVVSAGNSGPACNTVNTPAAIYEGSFSVGATNSSDVIANFSSRGAVTVDGSNRLKPNVSGPGVGVRSSVRGPSWYSSSSGTSMAGPHVAGVVALLISANPMLAGKVSLIEDIIEQTAVHLTSTQICNGTPGSSIPNNTFGFGRVDALAAVQMSTVSTYAPFVSTPSHIIISSGSGLVIKNTSGQSYRLSVQNNGSISSSSIVSLNTGSTIIKDGSIFLDNLTGGIILKSPNGLYYKLFVNTAGQLSTSIISSIDKYIEIEGDLCIDAGMKGIVIKNELGTCNLINFSTLGTVMVIPSVCP